MWQRDNQREREHKQVVGEEEAGSQQRSPMRDSFLERCDHALIRRQALNDCATQAPRDVGFLIFPPAFWGRGLPCRYSGNPVWVESPCPLRGGMGMGRGTL